MIALALVAATISLHQAKVQTFAALLRITEERPDVVNTTPAAIVVGACHRRRPGWLCDGALDGALIDGYPTRLCYRVRVRAGRRARTIGVDCP